MNSPLISSQYNKVTSITNVVVDNMMLFANVSVKCLPEMNRTENSCKGKKELHTKKISLEKKSRGHDVFGRNSKSVGISLSGSKTWTPSESRSYGFMSTE